MPPGAGEDLPWQLTVGGQTTSVVHGNLAQYFSYSAPVIQQISSFNPNFGNGTGFPGGGAGPVGTRGPFQLDDLDTNGNQFLYFVIQNLGPAGVPVDVRIYAWQLCKVVFCLITFADMVRWARRPAFADDELHPRASHVNLRRALHNRPGCGIIPPLHSEGRQPQVILTNPVVHHPGAPQIANQPGHAPTSGDWRNGLGVSYLPPVITAVYGDGSNKGPTAGGAPLIIEGKFCIPPYDACERFSWCLARAGQNFGPLAYPPCCSPIDEVRYGPPGQPIFAATNCAITQVG
jgi:hypothetical protein